MKKRKFKDDIDPVQLPDFCDYACPHAQFAPPEAVGACRREQGVWCTLLERWNNKNAVCLARRPA